MSQFLSNVINKVQAAAEPAPCVCCSTKDGLRRYNCAVCERDGFCFQCSNYCVVERSEQVVKTNKEKLDDAKESGKALMQSTWTKLKLAKEAAQKKYRERQQKKEGEEDVSGSAEGAAVEDDAPVSGGGLQDDDTAGHPVVRGGEENDHHDDNRPTVPCYRLAAVCRECFRHSIQDKIDLSTAFEIVDITVAEKEDGPLTADELSLTNDDAAVILGLHAACNSRKQLRGLAKAIVRGSPKTWVVLIDLPGHGGRMDEQPVDRQANLEAISVALEKVIVPLEGALAANSGADKETLATAVRNAIQAIDIPEPRANRFAFKYRPRGASVASQQDTTATNPPAPNNSFANNSFVDANLAVPSRTVANSGHIRRVLLGNGYGSYMGMEFLGAHPEQFDAAIMLNCGYAVGMEDTSRLSSAALIIAQEASKVMGSKSLVQAFINDLNKKTIRDTIDFDDAHANLIDCGTYYHTSDDQVGALRTVATRRSMYNYAGPVLFLDGIYDSSKNIVQDVTNVAVENEIDRNRRLKRGSDEVSESGEEDEEDGVGRQILSRAIHYPKGTRFFIHDTRFQNEVSSDVRLFISQLHQQPFAAFESLRTPAKVVAMRSAARNPTSQTSTTTRSDSSRANFAATPKESLSATPTPPTEPSVPAATAVPETAPAVVADEPVVAEAPKEEVVEDELAQAEEEAPAVAEEETAAAVVEEAAPEEAAPEVGDSPAEENEGEADAPKKKKGKGKKGGRK